MDKHKKPDEAFIEYAQMLTREQTEEIKQKYNSTETIKKSQRLKIFNEHLNVLKQLLHTKMQDVLRKASFGTASEKTDMEKKLARQFDDCIHTFLKTDFDK